MANIFVKVFTVLWFTNIFVRVFTVYTNLNSSKTGSLKTTKFLNFQNPLFCIPCLNHFVILTFEMTERVLF